MHDYLAEPDQLDADDSALHKFTDFYQDQDMRAGNQEWLEGLSVQGPRLGPLRIVTTSQ